MHAFRYASRLLLKTPGSSVVAVVTLALGIALTASMFSIIDGVLLKGLPFEESHEIVSVRGTNLSQGQDRLRISHHDLEVFRAEQQTFDGLVGYRSSGTVSLADAELPDRYKGTRVTDGLLETLELQPHIGRGVEAGDNLPGAEKVIVLGHHVWQSRYGGDPGVVGRVIRVNGHATRVVGVMPEGFRFPINSDVFLPLVLETQHPRSESAPGATVVGRLKDGATIEDAMQDLGMLAGRIATDHPRTNEGVGVRVEGFFADFHGPETVAMMGVMMSAVFLVLLVACVNVANLLLGRAFGRSRELAIRTALGSSRRHAVLLVLSEAVLIAAAGAGLGLVLARYAVFAMEAAIRTTNPPFWFNIALDGRTLLFTAAVTLLAALVAGFVPALQASRTDLSVILQDASRGSTSFRLGRLSRALVIVEVAVSFALLVGTGLMVRSVVEIHSYDLKIDGDNVLIAHFDLAEDQAEDGDRLAFFDRLQQSLASRPEIERLAFGTAAPADRDIGAWPRPYQRAGETYENPRQMPSSRFAAVSPGYFDAFGVSLVAGRDFTAADRDGSAAVAIVNERFAAKEWPGENPIGQRINLYRGQESEMAGGEDPGWVEVVGLVPDVRFADFDSKDNQQAIYVPLAYEKPRSSWVIVKTRTPAAAFSEPLRRAVLDVDPDLPLYHVHTMDQVVERTLFFPNLFATMFSIFGVVALVLGCVGLYGVMAFNVGQRKQEMGLRLAFGATAGNLVRLVLRQGLSKVAVGLVIGLPLAYVLTQGLGASLFQVDPDDPLTFVVIAILLSMVAAAACLVPALRASSTDPMTALQDG